MRQRAAAAGKRPSRDAAAELGIIPRETSDRRVGTGVPGLDDLVGGGFPLHRVVLLCGDIGTGKTTFGLQFLMAGVARDEAGVLVSVDEKPQHVIGDARGFGWDAAGAVDRGLLTVLDASPFFMASRDKGALDARHVAVDLTHQVRQAKASRLVIDGATALALAGSGAAAAEDFIRSLILSLEDNLDCTTVMTARTDAGAHASDIGRSAERLASGVIELKLGPAIGGAEGDRRRSLLVRKMRGAPTAIGEQPLEIVDGAGLVLQGPDAR